MRISNYVIQDAPKSRCKNCGEPVRLLARKDGDMENYPAFYCCPDCGSVAEVGVGSVADIEQEGE